MPCFSTYSLIFIIFCAGMVLPNRLYLKDHTSGNGGFNGYRS